MVLFFTAQVNGQTSKYHPFPDNNASWNFHYTNGCYDGINEEFYSIIISGDTIINWENYQKIYIPYVQILYTGSCTYSLPNGYKGGIREDTTLKKVFFVHPNDTSEYLLYDFNLQVGDTLKGYLEPDAYQPDTIILIDSVLVGESYRKRWFVNSYYNIYIIEGIGSTYGLIDPSPVGVIDANDNELTCYSENGISLYSITSSDCEMITMVNSTNKNENKVIISPNPSFGALTINFEPLLKVKEIRLADIYGNIILQRIVNNESEIKIDN